MFNVINSSKMGNLKTIQEFSRTPEDFQGQQDVFQWSRTKQVLTVNSRTILGAQGRLATLIKSHNVEVKLRNLYQFAEAYNGIASCKIFCPSCMFHHFTMNCICLMLSLHELKQTLVLVKQFCSASSTETFLSSRYYSHGSSFSQLVVCTRRNVVKAFKFSK